MSRMLVDFVNVDDPRDVITVQITGGRTNAGHFGDSRASIPGLQEFRRVDTNLAMTAVANENGNEKLQDNVTKKLYVKKL